MSTFKNAIINFRITRALKHEKIARRSIGYEKAHHIGVVFTVGDAQKHRFIKSLIKKLENDGKKVDVISFLGENQENHEFKFDFFTEKDVSILGAFKTENVIRFIEASYDYLFHVDMEPNIFVEHLMAKSAALCRIGYYCENKKNVYEMMVKTKDHNIEELVNQLYHYTSSLI